MLKRLLNLKNSKVTDSQLQKISSREEWDKKPEFFLTCLGYVFGLGNIWRFPYVVYDNGGGIFLLVYFFIMVIVGFPGFLLEMILGQYSGLGLLQIWCISPLFKGIGIGMIIASIFSCLALNVVQAWTLIFFFSSFSDKIPWKDCHNYFNTYRCYDHTTAYELCEKYNLNSTNNYWWFNFTCFNDIFCIDKQNLIGCNYNYVRKIRISSTEEYFRKRVLNKSKNISDHGSIQLEILFYLILSWIISWLCVIKGIRSTGKVAYFTAIFPCIVILIFLIRGYFLKGALNGAYYYLFPDFQQLLKPKLWIDATSQAFFSLNVAQGGLMTLASYNKFHNNIYRDSLLVFFFDLITSFLCGIVIFFGLGHLAYNLKVDIKQVAKSGIGLVFIVYPEVVTYLYPQKLWSSLFFAMILSLGYGTQMATLQVLLTTLTDEIPLLRGHKIIITGFFCFFFSIFSIPFSFQSGEYWLELMTIYSSIWPITLNAAAEIWVFSFGYGITRVLDDLETMTSKRPNPVWWYCISLIFPLCVLAILLSVFINKETLDYPDGKPYEVWSLVLGWFISFSSVISIPITSAYVYIKSKRKNEYANLTSWERFIAITKPSSEWMTSLERKKKLAKNRQMSSKKVEISTDN